MVPQNPSTLSSRVDFRFMPKMEETMAPMDAAKPAMDNVSSNRFTCGSMPPLGRLGLFAHLRRSSGASDTIPGVSSNSMKQSPP